MKRFLILLRVKHPLLWQNLLVYVLSNYHQYFQDKPDLVFAVGDRFEVMAVVLAASYMNIPIAHTMGGEVTGTIDESIRHAITKFSHLHFSCYKRSCKKNSKAW